MCWVTGHRSKPGYKPPETLLMNCRLDGEAYGCALLVHQ
jgi:hypothetical protein